MRASFEIAIGRAALRPFIDASYWSYGSATIGGVQSSQRYRDRFVTQAGVAGRYSLGEGRDLLATFSVDRNEYFTAISGEPLPSSTDAEFLAGLDYQLNGALRFRILAGLQTRAFDNHVYQTRAEPVGQATITWIPQRMTTVALAVSRSLEDLAQEDTGGTVYSRAEIDLTHELKRNVVLREQIGVSTAQFLQLGGTQAQLFGKTGFEWTVNRFVKMLGDLQIQRESTPVGVALAGPANGPYTRVTAISALQSPSKSEGMPFEITQVVQEFSTDGGTETVAWELQRAWDAMGVPSVVYASVVDGDTGGTAIRPVAPWLARVPTRGALRHAGRFLVVPGFTVAATWAMRQRRGSVIVSHGDCLTGDVLVVHAVNAVNLLEKRRAGNYSWMLNPMHIWVALRDRLMIGGLRYRVIVAVSKRVKTELMQVYGVPGDRIRVISNGIALDRFKPDPAGGRAIRAEFGIPAEARLLLFVGHEFSRKGLAHAAGALPLLDPDTYLLVVGAGEPDPYRRLAGAAAARMIFTGARKDLPALYTAADAFVFPTAYESFSLVCMEAMACGVPIFATAVGGIEDYISDGVNGMTIPQDAAGIAAVLGPVLRDLALLKRLGDGARATASRYGWGAIAERYRLLLLEVWREKRAAAGTAG